MRKYQMYYTYYYVSIKVIIGWEAAEAVEDLAESDEDAGERVFTYSNLHQVARTNYNFTFEE